MNPEQQEATAGHHQIKDHQQLQGRLKNSSREGQYKEQQDGMQQQGIPCKNIKVTGNSNSKVASQQGRQYCGDASSSWICYQLQLQYLAEKNTNDDSELLQTVTTESYGHRVSELRTESYDRDSQNRKDVDCRSQQQQAIPSSSTEAFFLMILKMCTFIQYSIY